MKLPAEEKIKIVESYLSGQSGASIIQAKYGIVWSTLRGWIRLYEQRGAIGLAGSSHNRKYDPETKRAAVSEYLNGGISQKEICQKYDISETAMFRQWIKWYNGHGDFKQPNNGGAIYMTKGRKTTLDERIDIVSYCIANNKDYGKTIEQYDISYQQIYGWVRKYEMNGADGLADHRGKRKNESSMNEVEKLRAQLKLKEAENSRLQMENELLKELEALERGRD
ncbi:MAG: transposase [Prevotellaceae bacterium]|nr:transposase [Prevotellaceae bacterium]